MAARSLSEHEETKSGVLPISGIHATMDPLEDKLHTLHATRHDFGKLIHSENEGPRTLRETDQVGHSSIASVNVTCTVTS